MTPFRLFETPYLYGASLADIYPFIDTPLENKLLQYTYTVYLNIRKLQYDRVIFNKLFTTKKATGTTSAKIIISLL